jgi:hypothetical protein
VARRREPDPAPTILTPDALRLRYLPIADCARYDSLRRASWIERTDILDLMSTFKLYGMRAAYDEVMAPGIKCRHEPPRIVGDLLAAGALDQNISRPLPSCRWPRTSTTATSPGRRSTRR